MSPMPTITGSVERIMGTAVGIDVRDDLDLELAARDQTLDWAIDGAFTWLRWVEQTFSVHLPTSEISRIARGELSLDDAHAVVREVLVRCDEMTDLSDGAFTARPTDRPGRTLDPSGLVKGWSVDLAAQMLRMAGIRHACVNAGGDLVCVGGIDADHPWRIGIKHPSVPDAVARVLDVTDGAVATSGSYERGEHIWRAGEGHLVSVTVAGPELGPADALATALFAAGTDEPAWLGRWLDRFPVSTIVTITDDGRIRTLA